MQGNIGELIRELMVAQQLSVRKVSARIAEKHGGSVHGYTQQVSRLLNDPNYDPSFSTVQKILSVLNVSLWQIGQSSNEPLSGSPQLAARLDQLSADVADLKLELSALQQSITALDCQKSAARSPNAARDAS